MNTKTVLVLNGPPRAGKDTAAKIIEEVFGAEHLKFSVALKDETHRQFGLVGAAHDAFEAVKDDPRPEFGGKSPREAYIETGTAMRIAEGADVFGRLLTETIRKHPANIFVVSDLASGAELAPLLREPSFDVTLVRIHRDGHDFRNDCRGYVYTGNVRSIDVFNSVDVTSFKAAITSAVRDETPCLQHAGRRMSAPLHEAASLDVG